MKMYSQNIVGNLHDTAAWCNKFGLAEYLVTASFSSGYNSVALFRVPDELYVSLKDGSFFRGKR